MIKLLRISLLIALCLHLSQTCDAQFPYVESFRNSTAQGIIFGGSPSAFLTAGGSSYDVSTSSHLGTPIDPNGNGYLRLTSNIQNQKGYVVNTTNFPSVNGLSINFEYYIYGGNGADGISLFLFDANASPFVIGGFGGSLGYAQITTTTPISPGVSNGYLAIGLDEYGNFSNPTEGRQGGSGFKPGSVTLRGKGNGAGLTAGNYSYLTSQQTSNLGFPLVGDGGQRQPDSTNNGYRRVNMELAPNPNGGYNITVNITRGGSSPVTTKVIDNYYYAEIAPANLRYGFASSTGFQTNFHEIRQITIQPHTDRGLTPPVAKNDQLTLCQGKEALIDLTLNDTTKNEGSTLNRGSIDLDPNVIGIQKSYTVAGKGSFTMNSQGILQFIPEPSFTGPVNASYTIADSFGITSNQASITLDYVSAPVQADAGQDQTINISTDATNYVLRGNNPGNNSGKWSQVSGPTTITITNFTQPGATVTNLVGGTYVFKWELTSPGGCTLFDEVQLIVNHIPVAVNDSVTTNKDTSVPISILANDRDADGNFTINPASIVIKGQPMHGTLVIDPLTGIVNYRPTANYSGYDSFVYTVKDNYGAESNTAIVTIAVNIKPVGVPDVANTSSNQPVVINVLDNDPGRIGAVVIKKTDPGNGTITLNSDGSVNYQPNPGFSGKDNFTYILQNKDGLQSDPVNVVVNVKPIGLEDAITTLANTPVSIPVKDNDLSKNGTAITIQNVPLNGTVTIQPNGLPLYTPKDGFSGKDNFTYILQTADGLSSDPITVVVSVKPVGSNDTYTTPFNVAVAIPVKDNDLSRDNTGIVWTTNPSNGTVATDPSTGIIRYIPNAGFSGQDAFTYILRTSDGISSDVIQVLVTVRDRVVVVAPNVSIETPVAGPKTIDIPIPSGGKINIITPPQHGTITFDPVTGKPIYTPNPGYSGPDEFVYVIIDKDGNSSTPGKVNISVYAPAKIGLAKRVVGQPVKNTDGSFNLIYAFLLSNLGDVGISDLSLIDDLSATFKGNSVVIERINATGGLLINTNYNGSSDKNLLRSGNTLAKLSSGTVELQIRVMLDKTDGIFNNSAVAEGNSAVDNSRISDQSTDGLKPDPLTIGDVSPAIPTSINLKKDDLFVPGGFSPNNDGINDYFVIANTAGKRINLDVFNRWGNLIYRSSSYQNDWNGRTTEGIHVGDEVPAGTYYYIITLDGADKRVGYITINR